MEVTLHKKQEFIDALTHYQPSAETITLLKEMPLVILLGVTGGGRNTIIDKLVKTGRYHFIVSDTTRPPKVRNGKLEQNGVEYYFRTEDEVLADIKAGKFLEAELIHDQQVSGNSVREIVEAHNSGKIPINEVDLGGTDAIAAVKPDTLFLFVVPPNFSEWMRRLHTREDISEQELYNRMQTAVKILRTVLATDRFVFVVNDDLNSVVETVDDYVKGKKHNQHNAHARQVTIELLAETLRRYPELA